MEPLGQQLLRTLRNSICAIGYLTVPAERFVREPLSPFYKVVGTGFVVSPGTAMTNRHVIQALLDAQTDLGFSDEQRFLLFVYPGSPSGWQTGFCKIKRMAFLENTDLDVGFCDFVPRLEAEFGQVLPLNIQEGATIQLGDAVILFGYPYGNAMLQRDGKMYRWGPVVQQGYVSAIAPFDTEQRPTEILLDVRVAGGMSGAPIVRPADQAVIGILHSTWEAVTALALPLTKADVKAWIKVHTQTVE